ncbi:MAG: HAMP domain-containing sensor histidine kinase [Patescibacteria group bacterium]|nr:HAMP domain-containing histidine kinase [Patescibacteria group bacterium]
MRDILEKSEFETLESAVDSIKEAVGKVLMQAIQEYDQGRLDVFMVDVANSIAKNNKIISDVMFGGDSEKEILLGHEVGTPIMALNAFMEFLRDSREREDVLRKIEIIKGIVWRIERKIRSVVFWTKEKTPIIQRKSLGKLLQNGKGAFEGTLGHEVVIDAEKDLFVTIDENILASLLLAMCANAGSHGNASAITIKSYQDGDEVILEVMDNGEGIDPEVAKTIFEYGFTTGGGKGIGLGDAEERLKTMGGSIEAQGHGGINGGAKFVITLQAE